MQTFAYPARLRPEPEGGFTVLFRNLPEAITHGEDRKEAIAQAVDCLDEAIANRIVSHMEIPPPSHPKRGDVMVEVPSLMAAKAALYVAMQAQGITTGALAKRLGTAEKEVCRMLDPKHNTQLTRLVEALSLLGQRLFISIDTAA